MEDKNNDGLSLQQKKSHILPEKRIACEICQKSLKNRKTLSAHRMLKHRQRPGHRCQTCSKVLTTKRSVDIHQRSVHEKLKPASCSECNVKCRNATDLAVHIRNVHNKVKRYLKAAIHVRRNLSTRQYLSDTKWLFIKPSTWTLFHVRCASQSLNLRSVETTTLLSFMKTWRSFNATFVQRLAQPGQPWKFMFKRSTKS